MRIREVLLVGIVWHVIIHDFQTVFGRSEGPRHGLYEAIERKRCCVLVRITNILGFREDVQLTARNGDSEGFTSVSEVFSGLL